MTSTDPLVSVIIPVRNERQRIAATIAHLSKQTYDHERIEVIIVDNGSDDGTRDAVQKFINQKASPNLRMYTEDRLADAGCARNLGIENSQGDLIAFTDADCQPEPAWLKEGVRAIQEGSHIVGGRVQFTFQSSPSIAEIYDSLHFLQHQQSIPQRGIAFTCNLIVRREVFDRLGLFNIGNRNSDAQFTRMATAQGQTLAYAPGMVVHHPARRLWPLAKKVVHTAFDQGKEVPSQKPVRRVSQLSERPHIQSLWPPNLVRRVRQADFKASAGQLLSLQLLCWCIIGVAGIATIAGYLSGRSTSAARPSGEGSPRPS